MSKTIDEIMYIVDGIDPLGIYDVFKRKKDTGIGYKPYHPFTGGTIIDGNYVGLDKTELDKLNEDELRETLKSDKSFFKMAGDYDKLNEEQKWTYNQIENESKYVKELMAEKFRKKKEEIHNKELKEKSFSELKKPFDELKEMEKEFNDYLENFDNLNLRELIDLGQIATELNGRNKISDEEEEMISERIREREQKLKNIKPIKRSIFHKDFGDELSYKFSKLPEDEEIILTMYEGSSNPILNNALDEIEKDIPLIKQYKGENYIKDNFNIFLGDVNENSLLNRINFIKSIFDYKGILFNTSNDKCSYYTEKLLNRYEYFKYLNRNTEGLDKNGKTKLDYMVVDFIANDCCFELKTLSKTFEQYKKDKFINLVSNKITGDDGEFKPIFNDKTKKMKNIICEYSKGNFECLEKTKELEYIVLFCLKDGNYIYKPLEDENFVYYRDKNGNTRGRLNYNRTIHNDYKIPVEKLIKIT